MATCYRHPSRETGVSCSNCGKPICPDCMTATPVGMRCPDCAGKRQRVRTLRSVHVRSEEHTSELQSRQYLVCRLLLEKKKKKKYHQPLYNKKKTKKIINK